ncbi:AEC family transporter [Microbacterium sp. RD1]|uniref:AEC family transporter n=1 Tax=Microbacterium sp. RD1 TaxID=3457313 RepID=UPI003FA52C5D
MIGVLTGFAVVGLAVAIGYVLGRTNLLGDAARTVLTRLTFFVLSPFLLFVILAEADVHLLFSALLPVSALTAVAMFALYTLLAVIFLRRGLGDTVVGAFTSGYVNANNIGIPLSLYILGNAAYSAPIVLFQLLIFMPVSLALLDAASAGGRSLRRIATQTLRNPMLWGAALGVLVSILGVDLPAIVLDPLSLIADACIPILLIAYGMSLHGQRVLTAGGYRADVLMASAIKLLVMPVTAWLLALAFALPPEQTRIVVVLAALPTAQNAFLFAQRYRVGEIIARDTIFVTTIACVPVLFLAAALFP